MAASVLAVGCPRLRPASMPAPRSPRPASEADLDAYIHELVGGAPALNSGERDTLALLLRRLRRR